MSLLTKFNLFLLGTLFSIGLAIWLLFRSIILPDLFRQQEDLLWAKVDQVSQRWLQVQDEKEKLKSIFLTQWSSASKYHTFWDALIQMSPLDCVYFFERESFLYARGAPEKCSPSLIGLFVGKDISRVNKSIIWREKLQGDVTVYWMVSRANLGSPGIYNLAILWRPTRQALALDEVDLPATAEQWVTDSLGGQNKLYRDSQVTFALAALRADDSGQAAFVGWGEDVLLQANWRMLSLRFVGLMLIVVAIALAIGALITSRITRALNLLVLATSRIGQGDWDIEVPVSGNDEVSQLGRSFQSMLVMLKKLFAEQKEKSRMENELQVARLVQETLMPPAQYFGSAYEVAGFYQSASECGGDVWGYWESDDSFFLYVADVTGHGVSAALVTSAIRSLVSFYEGKRRLSLIDVVEGLNKSVFTVGKSLHQSTGFFIRLDKRTRDLEYINASHVSMYKIPTTEIAKLSIKQVHFAEDPISKRLGEDLNLAPKVGTLKISSGDIFVLVTDGIFDLSMGADSLNEKKFLRLIIDLIKNTSDMSVHVIIERAKMMLLNSSDLQLKDDITLVALKFLG